LFSGPFFFVLRVSQKLILKKNFQLLEPSAAVPRSKQTRLSEERVSEKENWQASPIIPAGH
jgi:hypothetical protein